MSTPVAGRRRTGVEPTNAMPVTAGNTSEGDRFLYLRAVNGDTEAFGKLVERHQRRVWLVCRQYLGTDDADGAAQDTFVKAWRSLASFDGRSAFATWLTRIAINTCLDALRARKRRGPRVDMTGDPDGMPVLDRVPDDRADPERRASVRELVGHLRRAEGTLSVRQREVFRLRFYAEMELAEIAEALGVHVGTVKTQLHRAVHRVRESLEVMR